MSSYFENKANITAIEFVPMTAGQLVIEVYRKTIIIVIIQLGLQFYKTGYYFGHDYVFQVVEPECPASSPNWCSVTKRCETDCDTDFASLMYFPADANSLISGKYSCAAQEYCSNEQTCQAKPLTCPASLSNFLQHTKQIVCV